MGWLNYNNSKKRGVCAHCEKLKYGEEHHITPKCKGGTKTIFLCHNCHRIDHIKKDDFVNWGRKGGKTTGADPANWKRNLKQFRDNWADFPPKENPS